MTLEVRDDELRELMDDPECDPLRLRATLRRFSTVNRLVAAWGTVYRTHVRPVLAGVEGRARVLDLGCGGGDVVARLADLARRDGLDVEWTGADPDPRAIDVARERAGAGISFVRADASALVAAGERFDVVLSNHVLHHLSQELPGFLRASRDLSKGLVVHGDISRSRLAYALYAVGITPFAPGTFLRTDGLRSIRRSYTVAELQQALDAVAPQEWSVSGPAPFRLIAVGRVHA